MQTLLALLGSPWSRVGDRQHNSSGRPKPHLAGKITPSATVRTGQLCARVPGLCSAGAPRGLSIGLPLPLQELRPKSLDIKQEELGDAVEKEMASTSAAIEDAVRRIEVRWMLASACTSLLWRVVVFSFTHNFPPCVFGGWEVRNELSAKPSLAPKGARGTQAGVRGQLRKLQPCGGLRLWRGWRAAMWRLGKKQK